MPPALKRLAAPLLALLVAAPLTAQEPNRNARFGLPGPARAEPSGREAYLIARPQYILSYNAEIGSTPLRRTSPRVPGVPAHRPGPGR